MRAPRKGRKKTKRLLFKYSREKGGEGKGKPLNSLSFLTSETEGQKGDLSRKKGKRRRGSLITLSIR